MKVIIVIPTYNEAENIAALIEALFSLKVDSLQLIIIDDDSPDGTGQIVDDLSVQFNGRIKAAHRPGKLGLGTAYSLGFEMALSQGADVIIQMDADFSHSPEYIPEMIDLLEQYDVVVGSRFVSGGQVDEHWSWWRHLLSWWANQIYTRRVLGTKVHDATAGFKAFRRKVLENIELTSVVSNGYVFQVEIAYLCQKLGFRVVEIPIYFGDRRIGRSKMDIPIKLEAVWRVWQIRWRYRNLGRLST